MPIVGGNWKMNTTRSEARDLLDALRRDLDGVQGVEVVVCPPAPWLGDAADLLESSGLQVGAQNVYWEPSGAFTGEVSAPMLAGTAQYAMVGHSERRSVFNESDRETNHRLRAILDAGLHPILAVGERREQREGGETTEVLRRQLTAAFDGLDRLEPGFVIAYEPVWAIGTGLAADPPTAQEACVAVREMVAERFDAATAEACRIQYGGSVNADNVAAFAEQKDVDGVLVGGASLDATAFAAICRAVASIGSMTASASASDD